VPLKSKCIIPTAGGKPPRISGEIMKMKSALFIERPSAFILPGSHCGVEGGKNEKNERRG